MSDDTKFETVDEFDRLFGQLHGLPDVVSARATTITVAGLTHTTTFIVQTIRQRNVGDTLFVQKIDKTGSVRIAFPPRVSAAIARQRESLTDTSRSKSAQRLADERKQSGVAVGFAAMTPAARAAALAQWHAPRAAKSKRKKSKRAAKR
jgi:hypothetical protein